MERAYSSHFIEPQLTGLGPNSHFMKPWNIRIYGGCISLGENAHIVTARDRKVCLSTWTTDEYQGHITIGNQCLLCPGVRIDSASEIIVEDSCMIAAGAYLTDADWHDIYDRTRTIGTTAPIHLERNVWIGDGATVCKGVTIGENSIIGASAVVVSDIPANVIAAGNPARVVKELDPEQQMVTRGDLFSDPKGYTHFVDEIDRIVLHDNGFLTWIRTLIAPRRGD